MENSTNKPEGTWRRKLLRMQVYNISKKLARALAKYNKENNKSAENEIQELKKENNKSAVNEIQEPKKEKDNIIDKERESIMNILKEKSDFFVKRVIVWDIIYDSTKIWEELQFKCKYGLKIKIKNSYSLLAFCGIHGFIPMIDKIYIEWQDTSKNKEISTFYAPIFSQSSNQLTRESLKNEIEKREKMFQRPLKEVLYYIKEIVGYATLTYQCLLWENLWKLNNIWAKSENIFGEVALRLENQIRDKIWIESSYFNVANYKDDVDKMTDFELLLRKTPYQLQQQIPMQFTVGTANGNDKETKIKNHHINRINKIRVGSAKGGNKEVKVEMHLIDRINKWDIERNNFLLFFVNWEFWKHISQTGKDDGALNVKYDKWVNNPNEREKIVWSEKFPMFIDTFPTDKEVQKILPAEIIYIAFHMLYKRFNFKYSLEETYLNNIKNKIIGAINWKNDWVIKWIEPTKLSEQQLHDYSIKLSDICIDDCLVEEIENPREGYPWILKHRFSISYHWEPMWVIVIYEIEPKKRSSKKNKKWN